MNITLFCDASLCSKTGKGGWAAWLKSDQGTVTGGGPFRHQTIDTGIAEAMAAVNGIHLGLRRGIIGKGDRVLIQTDNNSVFQILLDRVRRRVKNQALNRPNADQAALERDVVRRNILISMIVEKYREMVERFGLVVRWRHVKGHTLQDDSRSAVNRFCDRTARRHMEAVRGHKKRRYKLSRRQRIRLMIVEMGRRRTESASNVVPFPHVGIHSAAAGDASRASTAAA